MTAISPTTETHYFDTSTYQTHQDPNHNRSIKITLISQEAIDPNDKEKIIQLNGYLEKCTSLGKRLKNLSDPRAQSIIDSRCRKFSFYCMDKLKHYYLKYLTLKVEPTKFAFPDQSAELMTELSNTEREFSQRFNYKLSEKVKLQDFKELNTHFDAGCPAPFCSCRPFTLGLNYSDYYNFSSF